LDQLAGIVFGTVIDDQNLEISMRLGGHAFQGAVEGVGTIEGRDENSKPIGPTVNQGFPSGSIRVHLVN
jgi:riboflavin synthase alpha subunit